MSTKRRMTGAARLLVVVYGILAVAALGRSIFQIIDHFQDAPIAFVLSAVSGVVYVVATIALAARLDRLAWVTIGFELVGVLVVGTISLAAPGLLGMHGATWWDAVNPFSGDDATVWSVYGAGYVCIPLVLPVLGLVYLSRLRRGGRASSVAPEASASGPAA